MKKLIDLINISYDKQFIQENKLIGGKADNKTLSDVIKFWQSKKSLKHVNIRNKINYEYQLGLKVEREHSSNKKEIEQIVKDHLMESPFYYSELKKAKL